MPIDPLFSECFIDEEHRVLGVKLRPFCLWHLFLLQALDSPVTKREPLGIGDLRTVVGVCRTGFRDSVIRKPGYLRCAWHTVRKGLPHHVNLFYDYVGDYLSLPEYTIVPPAGSSGTSPRRGRAPDVLATVSDIVGWSHWPEKHVWEMPIGAAYWYQAMAHRAAGADVDFMTDEERDYQRQLKEHLKKKKESSNGTR